ncbi:MAG: hypothetical protein IJX19_08020 [Clostridia bacterium]|nr:hypothetical protein [Clostridia bacterium]
MRFFAKLSLLIALVGIIGSVGGVFAVWIYFENPAVDVLEELSIYLGAFEYKPEDILPDREDIGESHQNLITAILNNTKIGLNKDKKDAFLNECLERTSHVLYNWETIQGNNIKHTFETSDMEALEFALQYFPETEEFLVYTCKDVDLESAETLGTTKINTYRTRLVKDENDVWIAKGSAEGYATVILARGFSVRVIDHESWTAWDS